MHTGTLISDLTAMVELCECRAPLGEHSHDGLHCPTRFEKGDFYRPAKFKALRCQAAIGSGTSTFQCEKEVVEGSDMCEGHQ